MNIDRVVENKLQRDGNIPAPHISRDVSAVLVQTRYVNFANATQN
jgi:hypothetical protein